MKRAFRDEWVAALRSGEFRQGNNRLETLPNHAGFPSTYCCLGVRCKLDADAGLLVREEGTNLSAGSGMYAEPGATHEGVWGVGTPAQATQLRWGLRNASRDLGIAGDLVHMNDIQHKSFSEIADYLDVLEVED